MSVNQTTLTAPAHNGASFGIGIDALIYGRASKDRHKLMRSIGDQVEECKGWCASLSWNVATIITAADRSASQWRRRERGGWEEAIELIRSRK